MTGYMIFEERILQPTSATGIEPCNSEKIGMLDFLREVKNHAAELPRFSKFCVVGLADVLYNARPDERQKVALEIRSQLSKAAQDLQRKLVSVQIVCKGKLIKGDSLFLEYRSERLPIDSIFGDILKDSDRSGNEYYHASFNLTSG
jgi:hypothetical protein